MKKTISAVIGKGDVFHNNRKIITENVDKDKISSNIILVQDDIKDVYHELFDTALAEYNSRQKRKDRMIKNYHEHIRHSRQEKEFHEVIFQIGNRDDTHVGTFDADVCAEILKKYAEDFQNRNSHLRVFNSVIHMDEETPHLHIDFVPFATEQKRGLSTRVSLTKALEQQGFKGEGKLNTASKLWIDSEKQVLSNLMAEHGIEWKKLGTERTHLSVLNYKKQERLKEISQADAQLEAKQNQINSAEYTLSYIQEKVNEKSAECIDLQKQANEILNYIPNIEKSEKLENKFNSVQYVLDEQLKSSFTIMRSKDEIKKNIDNLENITKKLLICVVRVNIRFTICICIAIKYPLNVMMLFVTGINTVKNMNVRSVEKLNLKIKSVIFRIYFYLSKHYFRMLWQKSRKSLKQERIKNVNKNNRELLTEKIINLSWNRKINYGIFRKRLDNDAEVRYNKVNRSMP